MSKDKDVKIITEAGVITLEPGIYMTPKALEKRIREEKGNIAITFATLRKQISNYQMGLPIKTMRLLRMEEADKLLSLVGGRGKYDRGKIKKTT